MISEQMVTGLKLDSDVSPPDPICEPCLAGKMHAHPFPPSTHYHRSLLELIHSDLHGPLPPTFFGYKYWITFIDDSTHFRAVHLLKSKSEAFEAFKSFKSWAENQLGAKVKALQDDKGGEYMSNKFLEFTDACGIERRHSTQNRPQQNGLAERANRTMGERITAMLSESRLPVSFWGECLAAMVHVWNRLPTSALKSMTPFEAFYGRKPDVSHLRVWGCTAYVHVQKDKRSALGSHCEKCVFVGYPSGYKGWKFYNPTTKKLLISERADFDERYFPGLSSAKMNAIPPLFSPAGAPPDPPRSQEVSPLSDEGGERNLRSIPPPLDSPPVTPILAPVHPPAMPLAPDVPERPLDAPAAPDPPAPPPAPPITPRRSARARKPPGEWWKVRQPTPIIPDSDDDDEIANFALEDSFAEVEFVGSVSGPDPRSYASAMSAPDAEQWRAACDQEMMSLISNNTWELVELPPGKKAINSGWVFKVKLNSDGTVERYKSRLVAKGCSQRPGYDYTEVFAPTFRPASLRLILSLAAREGYKLCSIDISSAFTYGELDEEIYMRQPEGYHQGGPNTVCRLQKSLYGLKQAARQWNKKLHSVFSSLGYTKLQSDSSIYLYSNGDVKVIVPVYIDDITLVSRNDSAVDSTIKELSKHFKLRDLGPTTFLLAVQVHQDLKKRSISLSQQQYVEELLKRHGMDDCKPVKTPMTPGLDLSDVVVTPEEQEQMKSIPYLSVVGSLQYLATMTRPDIAFAVSYLGRFNHNPGLQHWAAVKHLLRYLKGTVSYKLTYTADNAQELFVTYSDASHGSCKATGRATGGYVTLVCGGAVGWSSKRQGFVTLSSTEAEYVAAVEAGKEILWMRNILSEFGHVIPFPSTLFIVNKSGISVAKNPEHHGRMKHLDLRFYWLRDAVEASLINPVYVPTEEQVADIFTKPVGPNSLHFALPCLGLVP